MELSDRLRRMGVLRGAGHLKPPPKPAPSGPAGIEQWVRGEVIQTELGDFFLAREAFPLDHPHGGATLSALLDHSAATLARFTGDLTLADLDLRRLIFIDTETTGLAGGSGTYAFLIGVGRFEDDQFVVRQYFMRDYHEEPAMLHHLVGSMDGAHGLVSFNGKHFDLPLLRTRFLMSRLFPEMLRLPHLDLLMPARAVWKARLCSCALSSLEQGLLTVRRDGRDIPGFEIPYLYFSFLQTGNGSQLGRVFYHNAQDVLSMVVLTARLCDLFHSPALGIPAESLDLLSLGRLCQRLGMEAECEQAYRFALTCCDCDPVRAEIEHELSFLFKRTGRLDEAVALWTDLAHTGFGGVMPHVELAKYYEHHAGDLEQALSYALQARSWLIRHVNSPHRGPTLSEVDHRLHRLRRKQERQCSPQ